MNKSLPGYMQNPINHLIIFFMLLLWLIWNVEMHLKGKNWIFLSQKNIFLISFESEFELHSWGPEKSEKWNVDDDKKIIHGILPHLNADHLPFRFEVHLFNTIWRDLISRTIEKIFFTWKIKILLWRVG